jgi:hypothetical protein
MIKFIYIAAINSVSSVCANKVLTQNEKNITIQKIKKIADELSLKNSCTVCLIKICNEKFFDYTNQKKYSSNNNGQLFCYAFAFSEFGKFKLKNVIFLPLVALIFATIVIVFHLPRLLKQEIFKGLGNQN